MSKVLCVNQDRSDHHVLPLKNDSSVDLTIVDSCAEAMQLLREHEFDGLYFCVDSGSPDSLCDVIQNAAILELVPDGMALLDGENNIVRANKRLTSWFGDSNLVGLNFYDAIGSPTIIGSEPSPLASARSKRESSQATLSVKDRFYHLNVIPVLDDAKQCQQLIVTLSDSTDSVLQHQKLEALHQAGTALADLRPEEIYEMDVDHRIELLKDNILHYTKDLLDFDVVEIR